MKVHQVLAKAFVEEGVTTFFGLMGDANQYWLYSMAELGVDMYKVRHEGPAVAMAEAWAQSTGQVGVCTTTCGPGTAHIATQIIVANRNRTPLVAFCGDTNFEPDGANQRMDHASFAAAVECEFVQVRTARQAQEAVQQAFYLAKLKSKPVMLSAPQDIQQLSIDDDDLDEYVPSHQLLNAESIFPNPRAIEAAASLIAECERIVVIAGRGARLAGADEAVLKFANRTGALLATSLQGMNWLRDEFAYHGGISGLYATRPAIELFQEADCVVAVGASLAVQTTEHGYLFPDARYVQIDSSPQVIMGSGRSADCYIQSDARLGVEQLEAALATRSFSNVGYHTPETLSQLKDALHDPMTYEIEPGFLDPREVCLALDEGLPSHIGVSLGGGHQVTFSTMLLTRPRPFTLVNTEFGSMGKAMMGGIGAIIAHDFCPAAALEGDAGLMMHIGDFETAVRYGVPILVVVLNDQALGSELHKGVSHGLGKELAQIPTPDLGAVGIALGGRGARPRSMEEFRQCVAEFVADPAPTILDIRVPQTVVSVPYRRIHFGDHDV